ncbi:MAG: hypothetical protein ACR2M1_10495 [Gemmatimonadaceae bacterium]
MSNLTSHKTTTGYNALPYSADGSIVFDPLAPHALVGKAVKITGNRTVGLVVAGDKVLGAIRVVERSDGDSVKVTVQHAGQIQFTNTAGAPAVTPGSGIIGGATAGDVANAGASTATLGIVSSIETDGTIVVLPR